MSEFLIKCIFPVELNKHFLTKTHCVYPHHIQSVSSFSTLAKLFQYLKVLHCLNQCLLARILLLPAFLLHCITVL